MRKPFLFPKLVAVAFMAACATLGTVQLGAAPAEKAVTRDYSRVRAAPAPRTQSREAMQAKSGVAGESGCLSCHTDSDAHTMHRSPAVVLGCTDCHGGNPSIGKTEFAELSKTEQGRSNPAYVAARDQAHVLPRYPGAWHWPSSANPESTYQLLNKEAPEFVRFNNPSDYRAVRESCGACHIEVIEAAERSLMATGAMLWGGAAYNNGILPFKNYITGEAYTRDGQPALISSPRTGEAGQLTAEQRMRGVLGDLYPLPTWHVIPPGDVFRVFERGGRNIGTQFAEIGLPNPAGNIQRLEEPGRPDIRQSNRGAGPGACPSHLSRLLALAVERQPQAHLHPAQPRGAGVCALRQSVRLPRRPRCLRGVPHRSDRGRRALDHGVRRDAVGGRRLQ